VAVGALPATPGVHITRPAADLAPQLAAFSGTWQGRWGAQLPSELIVERITSTRAQVVYAWGQVPRYLQAGWQRLVVPVTPDGKLQWDVQAVQGVSFIFTMSADRKTIAGERLAPNGGATITMTRIGPSEAP
jgi:hypothetical protein